MRSCFVVIKMTSVYQRGLKSLSSVFGQNSWKRVRGIFVPNGIKSLGFKAYLDEKERKC